MSWLQAQIHTQLHKDGMKETPDGCKPPPCFPLAQKSSQVPDAAQPGMGWGRHNPPAVCQRHSSFPSLLLILGRRILVAQG